MPYCWVSVHKLDHVPLLQRIQLSQAQNAGSLLPRFGMSTPAKRTGQALRWDHHLIPD